LIYRLELIVLTTIVSIQFMMISLRAKLTLALIMMSFLVIGVVGLTARWIVQAQFDNLVVGRALENFISGAKDYYEAHGSWESAQESISFHEFNFSRNRELNRESGSGNGPRSPPPGGRPPRSTGPPIPFLVVDRSGIVLIDLAGFSAGDVIPQETMEYYRPIYSKGNEVGLAVALERPQMTEIEQRFLAAIELSWLYALLIAMILAISIGIVLGNVFSVPIKDLRKAIRAMEGGELRQLVKVRSQDEIGQLSNAFNQMSRNLADAYDELEDSRKKLVAQADVLKELSLHDELTGLLNRRAFDEHAATLFAQAKRFNHPITLGMADIDFFKRVNDNFSHATGDSVLKEIARIINDNLREIDLLARYGGEEFAISFPQTDLQGAKIFANRLREMVAAYDWEHVASGLKITLSIGLAERTSEDTFKEILALADEKLYEAKQSGRNQVCA